MGTKRVESICDVYLADAKPSRIAPLPARKAPGGCLSGEILRSLISEKMQRGKTKTDALPKPGDPGRIHEEPEIGEKGGAPLVYDTTGKEEVLEQPPK